MPITIGIPFYNAEVYLADAIRSIFAQTYQEWELILVDDGSTDSSLEIARSVKDSRVRVIADGVNRRLPYRLNQITAEAKYDLIGRMDADDIISPVRFEKQLGQRTWFFCSTQKLFTGLWSYGPLKKVFHVRPSFQHQGAAVEEV